MGLPVGIVGLPNVGKSTTFNALTKAQNAESANYPFCTIEPNKAVVPVPDPRLEELAKIVNPERIQHSTIDFVDIAGLVKGASKGEGLGNQFLSNIRETEMILHMVRCFDDGNVTHVEGSIDPLRDIEIIESELIFADIHTIQRIHTLLQQNLCKTARTRPDIQCPLPPQIHFMLYQKILQLPRRSGDIEFLIFNFDEGIAIDFNRRLHRFAVNLHFSSLDRIERPVAAFEVSLFDEVFVESHKRFVLCIDRHFSNRLSNVFTSYSLLPNAQR